MNKFIMSSNKAIAFALCLCIYSYTFPSAYAKQQPNIIFILADDLGYGDLGCYGQSKINTPNIDKMASEGLKFTDHYAGSTVCMPSRASLLTGMDQGHASVRGNPNWTYSGNPVNLSPSDITVADELKKAGYVTAVIGKWGLAEGENAINNFPSNHGFDYFFGYRTHGHAHHYYWDTLYRNTEPYILKNNDPMTKKGEYTHDIFVKEALDYINTNKSQPFFLYMALTIPHLEVTVPEDSKQPYLNLGWKERKMNTNGHYKNDPEGNTTYAGMVSRMDRDIGRILDTLKALGIANNTLVIFTSDNGHEYDNNFFDSNGPLRGHKRNLYEGGIRIPMIAWQPGFIQEGSVSNHISAFWDFLPTACELAGIEPTNPHINGISFAPTLAGKKKKKQVKHEYLYWEFNEKSGPIQAIRKDNWKMVYLHKRNPELYDLSKDIGEKDNIIEQYPKIAEELLSDIKGHRTWHEEFPLEIRTKALKNKK